jgi:hypothetical protein
MRGGLANLGPLGLRGSVVRSTEREDYFALPQKNGTLFPESRWGSSKELAENYSTFMVPFMMAPWPGKEHM